MFPSWGNFGGPQSQNCGGSGPRKPPGGGQAPGFGGYESSPGGSLFSSLQEQHLQQMQQLQMLHQKQLQSVLHHGNNNANAYGPGHPGGYPGTPWHPEGSGHPDGGAQSYYTQEETPGPPTRGPPGPHQGNNQPPPPSLPANESQPGPPPPGDPSLKPPERSGAPTDVNNKLSSTTEEDKSLPLQDKQQLWYTQHLQNLQKLKQDRAIQNQKDGDGPFPPPPSEQAIPPPPPPSSAPPKGIPPPPPPKEDSTAPPPLPESENVGKSPDTPEVPQDPAEVARLEQLQAAAAQWQQVQQQRASFQYQALMQQHEKLQQILEKYQQLIQQSTNLQSMSAEMQLRHHEMQMQQFTPLFQDWNHTFVLWHEQFRTYHHKDQLKDYEHQWKQWQEQMNATNAHLQERVATLTAMVPFPSNQYSSGMMGQYGQYPGQDAQIQQQSVKPDMQPPHVAVGSHSEIPAMPPVRASGPAGVVRPAGPPAVQPPSFNGIRGPRFDHQQQRFDGPPRFDQPQQRFDAPPRFDHPQQRFDAPPRFDHPQQRFDAPPRFDHPPPRFDGPPRFDHPPPRFDGPPRFDHPPPRFDCPPRFEQPRHRFDGPPRFDQPRFGQQSRFEQPTRPPGKPPGFLPGFERPPVPQETQQQGPQPKTEQATKQPASNDSKTSETSVRQAQSEKGKSESEPDKKAKRAEDLTDDNLLENDGFFVQSDPIPQTLQKNTNPEKSDGNNTSNSSETPKSVDSKPAKTPTTTVGSNSTSQNTLKPDGPLKQENSKPPLVPKLPGSQPQPSTQMQSRPDPPRPSTGRGRGQSPVPVQMRGGGRGQMGSGEFRGPNIAPLMEKMKETSCNNMPPEEGFRMPEQREVYHMEDPSYEECDGGESEVPPEEMWMPEEHYFSTEDEYYEDPFGPHIGRGGPPMMRGGPHMGRGFPPMGRGGMPMGRGGPPMARGGPPMGRGGPPMGRGGPPMGRGGPPMGIGGPPMGRGGPPMGRGGPPMGRGGPPMGRGGPPMGRGGPPMGRGGPPPFGRGGPPPRGRGGPPPMGSSEPMDRQWEEPDSFEYSEEGDPYWGEWRPPMRGTRPPFPPGRGRPPRGHPGFMHQGRGRPPHPAHGPMDHEQLSHEMDANDTENDPESHPMYHGHDPNSHPVYPDVGRGGCRVPPPPHQSIDSMEEPLYDDEGMERELGWQPPHGRGRPPPPHEIIDRGGVRRRPTGRGMARGMWRQGPAHEEYEEGHNKGYVEDYGHGEDGFHWQRPHDYPPDDCWQETKPYESERNRETAPSERDYPPRMPPPETYRDGHWREEREREPHRFDEHDRGRDLRIREYRHEPPYQQEDRSYSPPRSEWERPSRLPPPAERGYPQDFEDRRANYEQRREDHLASAAAVTNLPESSVDQGASGVNILALSQHQHEIILKAAQELKLIREMKEGKAPGTTETQRTPTDSVSALPVGLLGLEIPPDVRNVLKKPGTLESMDNKPADYRSSLSTAPTPMMIPKTVDYGHGHEPGATVERISYGERIVLRPDPVLAGRGYDKEPLGPREPYNRDPYFDRRSDPYLDRREYSREKEMYRDKLPPEYERERFERERFPPRDRDESTQSMVEERSPLAPSLRSGYRERDRDLRDKEGSGSRDRDEHYGRTGYDRPPYERSGLDRSGPERYGHSSSPYGDRRSYPDERGPLSVPPLPPPSQPTPRVERKPEIKNIDDILKPPGRLSRPERIVIIMRGLPGSGKSHVAKLIRDKEVECGGTPPRVLVLDDYFMTDVEKVKKDPDTGRGIKTKVLEYEYEPEMEDTYRSSMLKTFKKTLDDGFFPFIILDTINDRVKHFDQFWSAAKTKGFEVYVAEITADAQTCVKRNVHGRTHKDIMKMSNSWEPSPRHMVRLDVRSLLQDAAIEEVEMEDFNPDDEPKEPKGEEEEEGDLGYIPKSKWEMDTSEAKLDKLDGLGGSGKRKREDMEGLDHYLQLPDDYATRTSQPGQKRVRWADLEEQKEADRKRAIGFVVGQTDWERITDESGQLAQRALNRTKYF